MPVISRYLFIVVYHVGHDSFEQVSVVLAGLGSNLETAGRNDCLRFGLPDEIGSKHYTQIVRVHVIVCRKGHHFCQVQHQDLSRPSVCFSYRLKHPLLIVNVFSWQTYPRNDSHVWREYWFRYSKLTCMVGNKSPF